MWAGKDLARVKTAELQNYPMGLIIAFDERGTLFKERGVVNDLVQKTVEFLPVKSDIRYARDFFDTGKRIYYKSYLVRDLCVNGFLYSETSLHGTTSRSIDFPYGEALAGNCKSDVLSTYST